MQLRSVPLFVLRPSEDLGAMAKDVLRDLPVMIQYLFRGLGVSGQSGWDLLSYLAFDQAYTSRLLALGYADAMRHAEELIAFLGSPGLGDNHVASTPHFETNGTPAGK
jgi:NTE family protein